jgi:hypothetical protein
MTEALNDLLETSMNELLDEIGEGDYGVEELTGAYEITYPYLSEAGVGIGHLEIAARKAIESGHSLPFDLRYAQKLLSCSISSIPSSTTRSTKGCKRSGRGAISSRRFTAWRRNMMHIPARPNRG